MIASLRKILERETARPDLGRGTRVAFAVTVPLLAHAAGWLPLSITFVVFAAQSVAIVDVRGAYTLRLGLLVAMTAILAGACTLGSAVSTNLIASILGAGLVAVCGGLWRHFTPDYGASLAISSTLLYLISVHAPPAANLTEHHGIGAVVGGLWGVMLQVANWPIQPQHPLRRAASDSWIAVADLFAALALDVPETRAQRMRECESTLRTTLDQTYAALASARATPLRLQLEELNLSAARLATRVVALNTALESLLSTAEGKAFAASLQPVLTSLTNMSRGVAVAVVSRQPGHLASCEVRMQRLGNLLRAVSEQNLQPLVDLHGGAQLRSIFKQIEQVLPQILITLRSTIDRADERAAFSLELFDLDTWTLRPLASAITLNRRADPALVRFTGRVTILMMAGVAAFKYWNLPNGYWLPLTMVIVLQPDYGSTRQRAAERVVGTLAGSIFASLLLWLRLPLFALTATTGATMFFFGFFLKRRYAVAVFFITLAVVLMTEAHEPVTVSFAFERIASTLAGGAIALLAALLFWPVWERDRLRPILASAIEANRDFLRLIVSRLTDGGDYDAATIASKRRVEAANSTVFSSLQRMMGDPLNRRKGLEQLAACANGNQRITRALTVLAVQLGSDTRGRTESLEHIAAQLDQAFDRLAQQFRLDRASWPLDLSTRPPDFSIPVIASSSEETARKKQWIFDQLLRIATELRAMGLAAADSPDPTEAPPSTMLTPTGKADRAVQA